jgi:apolipoprotein N-acyltransferase
VVLAGALALQFRGMVPLPAMGYIVFLALRGIACVMPYGVDLLLAHRLGGTPGTLVFPLACTVTEWAASHGPAGSWGSAAYSQYGSLAVLQILSVTGVWGVTFLLNWFAPVANLAWEQFASSRRLHPSIAVFAGIAMAAILAGGIRLAVFPPDSQTVRVASLSHDTIQPEPGGLIWQRLAQNTANASEQKRFGAWANAVNDDLLARAEREAQAGAKIVFWGEGNALVWKEEEPALIARGQELAVKHGIYLGMGMATWKRGAQRPIENKFVLVEPDGRVAWEYAKTHPPGHDAAMQVPGDGRLRSLATPYGNLSAVICFDADFPQLLCQAGSLDADILLDPSNDWQAIDPWHTQMASFRAIEEGFNLVRQTSNGFSAAYDYQGRQLAAMDHFRTPGHVMVSEVPTRGVRTLYSKFGDWFGWLCAGVLAALAALAMATRRGLGDCSNGAAAPFGSRSPSARDLTQY